MSSAPEGFSWERRKDGTVAIREEGRLVTELRGTGAARFVANIAAAAPADRQQAIARLVGEGEPGSRDMAGETDGSEHPDDTRGPEGPKPRA